MVFVHRSLSQVFRSRPIPALPTLPASAPQHGNHTFRGRATPAFARALPVARTSPLRRTEAAAAVRPRDCIRSKGGVHGGRALARIQLIEAPAILKCGSAERRDWLQFGLDPAACDDPFEARETVALPGASGSLRRA
jgi:hypothetical protein